MNLITTKKSPAQLNYDKIKFGDPIVIAVWNSQAFGMFVSSQIYSYDMKGARFYSLPFETYPEQDILKHKFAKSYIYDINNKNLPRVSYILSSRHHRILKISKNDLGPLNIKALNAFHKHFNLCP